MQSRIGGVRGERDAEVDRAEREHEGRADDGSEPGDGAGTGHESSAARSAGSVPTSVPREKTWWTSAAEAPGLGPPLGVEPFQL